VLIPCKNERENILECIESARMIGDEILVADSGSTDGTVQIVQKTSDCRLIQGEWNGYAAFKNWAIPQATCPWVLVLDADERVTEALASEIRQQLASGTNDVDAWRVWFTTYFMGHELRHTNWNNGAVRLIRRDVCRYGKQLVHEDIKVEPGRLRHLSNRLTHYSIRSYDQYFEKYLRYTDLSASQKYLAGRRATVSSLLFRPFLRFFYLYVLRGGFLDGRVGIQVCVLGAFFNTFVKQARLWEKEELAARTESSAVPAPVRKLPDVSRDRRVNRSATVNRDEHVLSSRLFSAPSK
jgi:(heptosyl)LPS beta-1,4-glucosyltransferase